MSRKDYKQGMSDAVTAYETFGEKQEAAVHNVEEQIKKTAGKVDDLGERIGDIADYITDQEKAKLYKLNTPVDIADLDDEEKQILVAVLYQLTADEEETTEQQKKYLLAVQQYVKINNPPTEIDLEAVENIESISVQKALLQVVLEYFRLGTHPDTFTEVQKDFLDCFKPKMRREIDGYIDTIVDRVGLKGLSEKYGPSFPNNNDNTSSIEVEKELRQFESLLEELARCEISSGDSVYVGEFISVSYIDIDGGSYGKDSFNSESECRHAAESRLRKAIQEAESEMRKRTITQKELSFYNRFKHDFEGKLESLRERTKMLRNRNTVLIIDEINNYLTASEVLKEARQINDGLTAKYALSGITYYAPYITYPFRLTLNMAESIGALEKRRLFAKKRPQQSNQQSQQSSQQPQHYNYNCLKAIQTIENDATEKLKEFQEEFNAEIKEKILTLIIEPIQKLLPKLRDKVIGS